MDTIQKVAYYLGLANLGVGIAGFVGPLVTGNRDRFININPGLLFGVFAINWLHALLHVVVGVQGLSARNTDHSAMQYLRFHGVLFAFVAVMGWLRARHPGRIHMVMGMAIDTPGNIVHTLWAVIGLRFGLR